MRTLKGKSMSDQKQPVEYLRGQVIEMVRVKKEGAREKLILFLSGDIVEISLGNLPGADGGIYPGVVVKINNVIAWHD